MEIISVICLCVTTQVVTEEYAQILEPLHLSFVIQCKTSVGRGRLYSRVLKQPTHSTLYSQICG